MNEATVVQDYTGEAIQAALDKIADKTTRAGSPVVIPAGDYEIHETLDFKGALGAVVQGAGCLRVVGSGHPTKDTRLIWMGDPGQPVIRYQGANNVIRDLSIYGRQEQEDPNVEAGACVEIIPKLGAGTGKTKFDNVVFANAKKGIHIPDPGKEFNCDYLTYDACYFRRLNTAYHVENRQSVGHKFSGITYLSYIDTAFLFDAGGDFSLDMALLTEVKRYFEMPGTTKKVGINSAYFRTGYLHYDNQNSIMPEIVHVRDDNGDGSRIVTFESIRMSKFIQQNHQGRVLFNIGGDVQLNVNSFADMVINRPVLRMTARNTRKQPRAIFSNVALKEYVSQDWDHQHVEEDGAVHWKFRDCWDSDTGGPVPNVGSPDRNWGT